MHIDIACSFPLNEMLDAHSRHRSICTMLGTKVRDSSKSLNQIRFFFFFFLLIVFFLLGSSK
jgi:NDP-sugar pyrophosphorylase family protein